MYRSATRHISPNNPPTFTVFFLAAPVTMVRESWQCRRSVSDYMETRKHQTVFGMWSYCVIVLNEVKFIEGSDKVYKV
jgi:hypothetical protein